MKYEAAEAARARPAAAPRRRPRLGFAGVGWIGRHRLEAVLESGAVEVAAVADPDGAARDAALARVPGAAAESSLEALLERELDAVVIATPSGAHAAQARAALERGLAVFCQKPLARTAAEAAVVVAAARAADRLLGVDFCYRSTAAMAAVRSLIRAGDLGRVYAADLTFHNAYGPDKAWFRDPALSGGGCLMDLGIHLVDLSLWALDFPAVVRAEGQLFHRGRRLSPGGGAATVAEDHALAILELASGAVVRIACSWNLAAGQDAVIGAAFHGDRGGAAVRNVAGSFYDFTADRFDGTRSTRLAAPPDAWGGRTIVAWAERLVRDPGYDPGIESAVTVAAVLDRIYGR
jgi:predicted dehydrogenase